MTEANTRRRLTVTKITRETPDAISIAFDLPGEWQPVYKPGQFLTLSFETSHGEKRRSYSISSTPALNEPLTITVKKIENGEFSRWLVDHLQPGDELFSSGIAGLFLLPGNVSASTQFFFIAAGSGITPCLPMIKTLLLTTDVKVVLIYSNREMSDTIFYKDLRKLELQYSPRFIARFLWSTLPDVNNSRLSNWLLQKLLQEYLQVDPANALFYLCGPFEYMRMATISLLSKIPADNIHKENFNTLPRMVIPAPPDTAAHLVTLYANENKYDLTVQYPLSILATAKANKIVIPYSCEAGRCGSCVATCTRGKTWMAYNEVLTDDEVEAGRVLLCQCFPVEGDVEIIV